MAKSVKNVINKFEFNGLVLAGGRSSRMGQDKALLTADNGVTLLQRSQNLLRTVGASLVLISSNNSKINDAIVDRFTQSGPVAGIDAALNINKELPMLILPVDMPLINLERLSELVCFGRENQSSAHFNEQCLPLFIFDSAAASAITEALLSAGQCPSVWSLCHALKAKTLSPQLPSDDFFNANSPEQWQECRQRLNNSAR